MSNHWIAKLMVFSQPLLGSWHRQIRQTDNPIQLYTEWESLPIKSDGSQPTPIPVPLPHLIMKQLVRIILHLISHNIIGRPSQFVTDGLDRNDLIGPCRLTMIISADLRVISDRKVCRLHIQLMGVNSSLLTQALFKRLDPKCNE